MFSKLKQLYRRLPSFSARFHIAFGLSSLLTSVVLLSMVLGFVPNRDLVLQQSRVGLAEAISATSSTLLQSGNLSGIKSSLTFVVERNPELHSIELKRNNDVNSVVFDKNAAIDPADKPFTIGFLEKFTAAPQDTVSVPIIRGSSLWGELVFTFIDNDKAGLWNWARSMPFSLMIFLSTLTFPLFYFYLGKMLKQLNPSSAVPARVRTALDTIAEALLVLDSKGNVVLANSAFAELTGGEAQALVGTQAYTLNWVLDDSAEGEYPWEEAFKTALPTRLHMVRYRDKQDRVRKFIVNCSPVMGAKGKVGGVLLSMDDVTLLEEKEILLRQSMEEAEAANHAKTAFLSNMSHEIRTPMTAILGFTEVLKRGKATNEKERLRHLNTISNSGTHLLELINDVLDLSKVESGAMEVEHIPCKAALISHEVLHVLNVKAKEKDIGLDMDIKTDLPEHIIGDPSRLRQIITNLVGNAIKFTEQGGVKVNISYLNDNVDPRLLIAVTDSGIGMSEKQLSTIFDAFTQADASITRRFGGTGLGLSISRQLAIAMGGDIIVSSVAGEGSTFEINIPVGDISGVPMLSPEQIYQSFNELQSTDSAHWEFPPSRILVVDDGPENRDLLTVVLGDLQLDVVTAENGKVGVDTLAEGGFDLVLMDIQMPVMDGYQAAGEMRKRGVSIPIVALTANAMKGFEEKVLQAGFSHYMTKPIDLDRLTNLLADLLGGVQSERNESDQVDLNEANELDDPDQRVDYADDQAISDSANLHDDVQDIIVSSFAQSNPKLSIIADQFVARLDAQFKLMEQAYNNEQWLELAGLAHWLKGSGGTVGYPQFADPAIELETASKNENSELAHKSLLAVAALRKRIRSHTDSNVQPISSNGSQVNNESANDALSITNNTNNSIETSAADDNPIVSSLPMDNVQFRGIVERFIPRLHEQIESLRESIGNCDYEQIGSIAHWLKGSGGNVGFEQFREPAATLEKCAHSHDIDGVQSSMDEIELLLARVEKGWHELPPLAKSA